MNKGICYLLLIMLFGLSKVFSQSSFKLGANIGGQISSLRGLEYETENDFELVPVLGLNFEISVTPSISFVTAINFERWKKKRDVYYYGYYGNLRDDNTVKEGYDFFNLPLLIRYRFSNSKLFFVEAGGFANHFNKGKPNGFMPLFINFEDYNFGVALGVGKTFYLNDILDITLQLRNELGLKDVNKYKTMLSGNVKTNTIRLMATFNVNI